MIVFIANREIICRSHGSLDENSQVSANLLWIKMFAQLCGNCGFWGEGFL